jgi:hypothetical protein
MTAPQNQFATIATQSQEAVTAAVNTWADTVQSFAGRTGPAQVPDLTSAVEQYFSFAEKVLADQRQLARQWVSAAVQTTSVLTEQAQRTADAQTTRVADATEEAVGHTAEATRAAADAAAANSPVVYRSDS